MGLAETPVQIPQPDMIDAGRRRKGRLLRYCIFRTQRVEEKNLEGRMPLLMEATLSTRPFPASFLHEVWALAPVILAFFLSFFDKWIDIE